MTQKPVAWAVTACSRMFMGEFAEFDAKAEARRCGGTCVAYALYKTPVVAPDVLKDAQRYRWLRDSDSEEARVMTYMEGLDEWLAYASAESVDMAIDAAMEVAND